MASKKKPATTAASDGASDVKATPETSAPKKDAGVLPSIKTRQKDLFASAGISRSQVKKSGVDWKELAAIFEDHSRLQEELEDPASFVAVRLRRLPTVHSVRTRVKKPGHLVQKIVRKRTADPSRVIGFANYKEQITDRIGVRALHLFKEDWRSIHDFVVNEWDLLEKPIAYHRDGDLDEWLAEFSSAGCSLREHPKKYRSVHYLLRSAGSRAPTVVELQVRTVFEEAWSEIDHRINYPSSAPYPVGFFLEIFNRLAGSADEMGSFIHTLMAELTHLRSRADLAERGSKGAAKQVEALIEKLEISDSQRQALKKQIKVLRDSVAPTSIPVTGSVVQGFIGSPTVGQATIDAWTGVYLAKTCASCGNRFTPLSSQMTVSSRCPKCERKNLLTL